MKRKDLLQFIIIMNTDLILDSQTARDLSDRVMEDIQHLANTKLIFLWNRYRVYGWF